MAFFVFIRGQREQHVRLIAAFLHGARPGKVLILHAFLFHVVGVPGHLRQRLPQKRIDVFLRLGRKCQVRQHDIALSIHHHDALGQQIQRRAHTVGDHGFRIQILQGFFHEEHVSRKTRNGEKGQKLNERIFHQSREIELGLGKADFDGSPFLVTRKDRNLSMGRRGALAPGGLPVRRVIARKSEGLTFDIDQSRRHNIRVTADQRLHGLADRIDFTRFGELGKLHGERLTDFLALIEQCAPLVARQAEHHVTDEHHAQSQTDEAQTHPHERIDVGFSELEPFEFQLFHCTDSRALLFARGIEPISGSGHTRACASGFEKVIKLYRHKHAWSKRRIRGRK